MTEETQNLILRLLRDIRADIGGVRDTLNAHSAKFLTLERRMAEMNESIYTALGIAAHGNVVVEQHGGRLDSIMEEIAALKRRMSELESRT